MKIKDLIRKISKHLSNKRKKQLISLFFLMILSGFIESFSIASVIPFLIGISNPNKILSNEKIIPITNFFNINTVIQFQIAVTILFASTVVITSLIKLVNIWLNQNVAASIGSDLSCKVYTNTLNQPYKYHIEKNSSEIITVSFSEINYVVVAINATLQLFTSLISSIFCVLALLVTNYVMALLSGILFSFSYFFIASFSKKELSRNSSIISISQKRQMKSLQEGIGGIKDILLNNSQNKFINIFKPADILLRKSQAKNTLIASFPRYFLEALALLIISISALYISIMTFNNSIIVPLLGGFALGAQRLLISMQQSYSSWARIKAYKTPIQNVIEVLDQCKSEYKNYRNESSIQLKSNIEIKNLYFKYPSSSDYILKNINLKINSGDRIGIIGSTGSGKSTLMDILMGLLEPSSGNILIDQIPLKYESSSKVLSKWKASVAHVPQNIFLSDTTFAENIAFGVEKNKINMSKVKDCAIKAKISGYIESCPLGYNSICGERGARLSGGQRQRIGIARALYKKANVIFFDEATSSLDNQTETAIVKSIDSLSKKLTIVIIAHRMSTIKSCDFVIKLEKGKITGFGTPKEIIPFKENLIL